MHFWKRNEKHFLTCVDFSFQPLVAVEFPVWTWMCPLIILANTVGEMLGLFHFLSLSRCVTGIGGGTVFPWITLLESRGSPLWAGSTAVSAGVRS